MEEQRDGLPVVHCATPEQWSAWLAGHEDAPGAWLVLGKKGSGTPSPSYEQAVEEALCVGWIDGQSRSRDEQTWLQRFTPRRARSAWSQVNRERVARLQAAGRMRPAGLAAVAAAQADGRWDRAYAPPSRAEVPEDLRTALDASPAAAQAFAALDGRNRFAVLHRVQDAKRPETRARRIATFVEMLARGERLHL